MNERILIRDGRVIDPAQGIDGVMDVCIAEGRIAGVGHHPDGFTPERVIEASHQVVCPGFIDICARLREPGFEHKATIAGESLAAAASGIVTVCMPMLTATARLAAGMSETEKRTSNQRPAGRALIAS
jgi:dihydroorotase